MYTTRFIICENFRKYNYKDDSFIQILRIMTIKYFFNDILTGITEFRFCIKCK